MLREWTAAGYVTRDHIQFALPYRVEAGVPAVRTETDNVISVDFGPVKRQDAVEESRKIEIEEAEPARTQRPARAETSQEQTTGTEVPESPAKQQAPSEPEKAKDDPIAINQASHEEIAAVKGISRKVADNIVAARPFESVDDLLRVKGIGARMLARLRKLIRI